MVRQPATWAAPSSSLSSNSEVPAAKALRWAQHAAGEGGGAEADGLSAIETAAVHDGLEHGFAPKGPFPSDRTRSCSGQAVQPGQVPRRTTSWPSIA